MCGSQDIPLSDEVMLEEIELLTELIIAATVSPTDLTQERIDDVLGVSSQSAGL